MKNVPNSRFAEPASRQWKHQQCSRCAPCLAIAVFLFGGLAACESESSGERATSAQLRDGEGAGPAQLRQLIAQQGGGLEKLMVPANDSDLPHPRLTDGSPDPFFQTTEAKRYLGKQLFFEPFRMTRSIPG